MEKPRRPDSEEMLMMLPEAWRENTGKAARVHSHAPVKLVSMTSCHSATSISTLVFVGPAIPPLLTRTSTRPKVATARETIRSQSSVFATSVGIARNIALEGLNLFDGLFKRSPRSCGHYNASTLARECHCYLTPDAVAAAGDDST